MKKIYEKPKTYEKPTLVKGPALADVASAGAKVSGEPACV
jgi:hypothetical protein